MQGWISYCNMSNNEEFKVFKNELKACLGKYNSWNPKLENRLKSLGFIVESDRKHAILYYIDNETKKKSVFVISKTPSDKRAGMNNVGVICRTLLSQ